MTHIKSLSSPTVGKRTKGGLSSLLEELAESVEPSAQEEALAQALEEGDLETVSRDGAEALAPLRELASSPEGEALLAGASEAARELLKGE